MIKSPLRAIRRSLRLKLVLVSVGIEVLMLALLLGNSLRLIDGELERYAEAQVADFRELLDASLSLTLFQRDHAAMSEMLRKLLNRQQSSLKYVVVEDETGQVFAYAGKVDLDALPALDQTVLDALNDGVYDAAGPLRLDVMEIGSLRFGVSLESFIATKRSLLVQGMAIAGIEVLLSLLLLGIAGYVLTRHLGRMVNATRRVAEGRYDIAVRKDSEDEIGQLADNFNSMAVAIRERVDALESSERALFEEKEKAWVTLHSIGDGVITTDADGRVEILNPIAEALTGWTQEEARGHPIEEVFVIQDETSRRPGVNPILRALRANRVVEMDEHTVLVARDGKVTPINDSAAPIRAGDGQLIGAVLVFHDISTARQMASQIAYQARHDALTGLVNRGEFERRLQNAVDSAVNEGRHHVVCYLDLDQFKLVNDTSGHMAGDELLREIATTLKGCIRELDTLARLGGDEFGVLLENCPLARGREVAEELRRVVKDSRFSWEGRAFDVGVSIGMVAVDQQCAGIGEVMSAADVACYLAKEQGRNRVYFRQPGDQESERRQLEMDQVSKITSALADDRFELYVQEIRPLQRKGGLRHYEILLRMLSPEGEQVMPAAFIPAAERYHLMHQVDRWVIERTLRVVRDERLHERGMTFSINLSGQTLAQDEFLHDVLDIVQDSGVPPSVLCFEITETAAISHLGHAGAFIAALKRLGCTFALDDFGSGLSSFAYLKNLNVDFLKIDGSFVKDMLAEETDAAMVEAINQLGHVMGLKTIAEYVEDDRIRRRLTHLGVDFGQGFGIHRPEHIDTLIRAERSATVVEFPRAE